MKKTIITISREFGSGGRTIGRKVAQELGFAFYDKELIEKVAEESGFDKQYIEEQGEYAPAKSAFAYAFIGRDRNGMSVSDYIWQAQRKIIFKFGRKRKLRDCGTMRGLYFTGQRRLSECIYPCQYGKKSGKNRKIIR